MIRRLSLQPQSPSASDKVKGLIEDVKDKKKKVLLHGKLLISIYKAKGLPNLDNRLSDVNLTDGFVDVCLDNSSIAKTFTVLDCLDPVWNENYRIDVCHSRVEEVLFKVYDEDSLTVEKCGSVKFKANELLDGLERTAVDGYPIRSRVHRHDRGRLFLSIQFIPISEIQKIAYEIDGYFSIRQNCRVTLYQDAHVPENVDGGMGTENTNMQTLCRNSCWRDVHSAIIEAEQLICITGWSVCTDLKLFRGEDRTIDPRTLGQILIDKANRGVKVYVMVWDEATTGKNNVLESVVTMGTHDEDTFRFFENTEVKCVKAGRCDNTERTFMEKGISEHFNSAFVSTSYSHHQKTIICDSVSTCGTPIDKPRRLVAFVGGLDLTDGRWDTPNHELFSTLTNEHDGDFYQKYANVSSDHGPRQPWHDIHSKVEGTIAYDVFQNFYERWRKQGLPVEAPIFEIDHTIMHLMKNSQLPAAENPLPGIEGDWTCRLFRSITGDSAKFDHPLQLSSRRNTKNEMSILEAYVHIIRKAEKFIYIENQYFYGSSYAWDCMNKPQCRHIIPMEIAQKIANKIRQKETFIVYIVVPMFPEGDPSSKPLQEILYYQYKTMEMMYRIISEALYEVGSRAEPTDFLFFMCPAKREDVNVTRTNLKQPPGESNPVALKLHENMRCPIYVHSKMMIIDDTYIIVGSANINQRSMAGTRDTEIAVGCRQEKFGIENPFGDVASFRKSLFTEHFGGWYNEFEDPSNDECIKKVKRLTIENWTNYISPGECVTKGHMLQYPVHVQNNGKLSEFIGTEGLFPDFGAKIAGKRINLTMTQQHQRVLT